MAGKIRIGVLSDTHGHMDERILHHLKDCDTIWHAGDIGNLEVTDALRKIAPVIAVHGNIDNHKVRSEFPAEQLFLCGSQSVYMTHIVGRPGKYNPAPGFMVRRHKPNILVCGHSHILLVQFNKADNLLHINPGAAGKLGLHKMRTLVRFEVDGKSVNHMEVVELGLRVQKTLPDED